MIKQLLINGQVNRYTLSNRARQAISFQYITDTETLRLIDTYNNIAVDLVAGGDNALTSSAMEKVWQYIKDRVEEKSGGAFHFRGTVNSMQELNELTATVKAGDVYQVTLSTGRYDPNTGQLIPSTITTNDKEFAWAEKTDPQTGLPTGGQWIELGLNFNPGEQIVTKDWVEQFMQTKQHATEEHEAISTYISTVSSDLKAYINITAQNLTEYINETAQGLSTYVDETATNLSTYVDSASANIISYIDNVVSTSIIYYVNEKVGELSGHIDSLRDYVDAQDNILSTAISDLKTYVDQKDGELSTIIDNFSAYVINRMDVESGGFVTNDALNLTVNNIIAQHQKDLSFILYNDDGDPINWP